MASGHLLTSVICVLAVLTTVLAVRCKNCRNVDGAVRCDESCQGDVCVLWEWSEKSIDHLIQGCMTGLRTANVTMGCRRNADNAALCLCNDGDECNARSRASNRQEVALPTVECRNYVEAPFISPQSKEATCRANFCFFTQTSVSNFKGELEMQTTANCGQLPQYTFDVQVASIWPGPGVVAGGCYLLQANGQDTTLGCMCSTDGCNLDQPYPIVPGGVRCHLGYNIPNDSASEKDSTCQGDFCLIQKTSIPQFGDNYMKGCLSIGGSSAAKRSVSTGYRNILGVEQWVCKTDLCNRDIDAASAVDSNEVQPHVASTDSAPSAISSSIPTVFLVLVATTLIRAIR